MRLAFVIYGSLAEQSGGFRYDRKLVEELRERGHEVRIVGIPWESYHKSLLCNATIDLQSRLSGFDVVLEDHLCHPSLLRVNRVLDTPIVSVVHHLRSSEPRANWQNSCYRTVERVYFRSLDAAICNSETTRQSVESICRLPTAVGYPAGNRFVKPTDNRFAESTDNRFAESTDNRFAADDSNRSNSRDFDGPLQLVFLGNIIERKGLHVLLHALADVSGEWQLTVIGAPTDEKYAVEVRQLRNRLGLRESVAFTGRLPGEAVADRLARYHALVVPSLYEGFGLVYLEGMALGLPAVGTTAGGASEIVSEGETGFLLPPGDSDAIAGAVRTLRDDRTKLREMSKSARERYESWPSWGRTAEAVERFLTDIDESGAISTEP